MVGSHGKNVTERLISRSFYFFIFLLYYNNMETDNKKITFDISWGALLKVVAVILAAIIVYLIRDILVIFIISLILATLIDPLAGWFSRHRIPRGLSVLLIYLVLIGALASVITLIIPPLVEQFGQAIKNLSSSVGSVFGQIISLKDTAIIKSLSTESNEALNSLQADLPGALSGIFSRLTGFLGSIVSFLLILVLTFYIVVEGDALKKFFKSLAPEKYQPHLVGLMTRAQHKMGFWLRGVLILAFIIGVFNYVGLTILGIKYALVLAILGAVLELIPYLGPFIATIPAVFLAYSQDPIKALFVLILYIFIQRLENDILVPKVMQKTVGLNPVVSIMSLGIGYTLAGFFGALLAIPVATAVSVFVTDFIALKKKES